MADASSAHEMKEVERAAFDDGIDAESLMDRAGEGIANASWSRNLVPVSCVAYLGKGNNAGDAIVAESLLAKAGWEIWTRPLVPESDLQALPKKKLQHLDAYRVPGPITDLPKNRPRVILDGLLGLGSRSGLNAPLKALTREINALRLKSNATVYAVDLPTGLGRGRHRSGRGGGGFHVDDRLPENSALSGRRDEFCRSHLVIDLPELTARGPDGRRSNDPLVRSKPSGIRPAPLVRLAQGRFWPGRDRGRFSWSRRGVGFVFRSCRPRRRGADFIVCPGGDLQPRREQGDSGDHGKTDPGHSVGAR